MTGVPTFNSTSGSSGTKSRVSYYYHPTCPLFYYGPSHPMKPHRLKLAHHLILSYGLYKEMECYRPHPAQANEMTLFHSEEYVNFLSKISPDNLRQSHANMARFNAGDTTDCPVFDGLFEFTQLYTGASLDGAVQLNSNKADVCINWSGGLHHAKKSEASGFCYINDIVLAILELLKVHARVLYVDIDVHHGDGVEEAFYNTNRVMTFSLHKYGDFFPGTGHSGDIGIKDGKGFSVNAPLNSGITDDTYKSLFEPVLTKIMDVFQPGAIVLQCGADSLTGDRLGCFNLTLKGHAECVKFVQSFNIPTLVLGGGGYTIRNVARCWAYETAVLLKQHDKISNDIPFNDYYEYYAPDFHLHLTPEAMDNLNTKEHLDSVRTGLLQQLQELQGAPSVQIQQVPAPFERVARDENNDISNTNKDSKREHVSGVSSTTITSSKHNSIKLSSNTKPTSITAGITGKDDDENNKMDIDDDENNKMDIDDDENPYKRERTSSTATKSTTSNAGSGGGSSSKKEHPSELYDQVD